MELPSRNKGDRLITSGECLDIRRRLRRLNASQDISAVVINAFDYRTRILPFFYSSKRIAPAGARAIGSALYDSGISKTRIVLQQWNPNVLPSRMRLDGRPPDLLLVSSMQIHSAACEAIIRDACKIPPDRRPLIIAGGPNAIYEPWTMFGTEPSDQWGADVVVTGEEYVLLNLLEVLLSERSGNQSLRSVFDRARDRLSFDNVPGLVYPRFDKDGLIVELVDTGIQRLVGDLDELPHPLIGFQLLEAPSRSKVLAPRPIDPDKVRRFSPIASLVFTTGCKFSCPYCPIPAYNQRLSRSKSPDRIADEMIRLHESYGIGYYFGTDDNFFNDRPRTISIVETLARAHIGGRPLRKSVRWGTEVTVHDTLSMMDHLPMVRKAGAMTLWLGVEDITARFVKKGQSVDKTLQAFDLLRRNGISAVPMLMHHEGQPFYTRRSYYGLINQVRLLRKAGAVDVQVLAMTPAVGSRNYEEAFYSGKMIHSAAGRRVEPCMLDGNYVVASAKDPPWRMQLRVMGVLAYFYNPIRLIHALIRPRTSRYFIDAAIQLAGMWGLAYTLPRMAGWFVRLMTGRIKRQPRPTGPTVPLTAPGGAKACHGHDQRQTYLASAETLIKR